nr:hypothetical protein [Actinidia tombus-like virus]
MCVGDVIVRLKFLVICGLYVVKEQRGMSRSMFGKTATLRHPQVLAGMTETALACVLKSIKHKNIGLGALNICLIGRTHVGTKTALCNAVMLFDAKERVIQPIYL